VIDSAPLVSDVAEEQDQRILILAPSGRDTGLAEHALARAGMYVHSCEDLLGLRQEIAMGAGVVLVAEEALPRDDTAAPAWIGPEPAWSSLPVVVLTTRAPSLRSAAALRRLEVRPNVTFLERPLPKRTLISIVRAALENRRRQYAVRDYVREQVRLRKALQESEGYATRLLESIAEGFIAVDRNWRITFLNPHGEKILRPLGKDRHELLGMEFWDAFPKTRGTPFEDVYQAALRDQAAASIQAFYAPLDSWFDVRAYPSKDGLAIHFLDIGERKRAEKKRELLINELNHRVKNTLAIVQAIAHQTFHAGEVPAHISKTYEDRLAALATAHQLLTQSHWEHAFLDELAERTIASCGAPAGRIRQAGPHVPIPPKKTVTFAMALHELCTNAIKYGALSTATGRVDLAWSVADAPDRAFQMVWRESGGPAVTAPARKGFGLRLIEYGLAQEFGGRVTVDFAPTGLICTIEGALPRPEDQPQ
jgi:two-component sensor histidine kinase